MAVLFIFLRGLSVIILIIRVASFLSSNTIFYFWVSIEINILSFVMYLLLKKESDIKSRVVYFLVQALGSAGLLQTIFILYSMPYSWLTSSIILIFLGLKIGLYPMHLWVISSIRTISGESVFLFLTFQKVIPAGALILVETKLGVVWYIFNIIIIALIINSSRDKRKIIAYGSVASTRWILLSSRFALGMFYLFTFSCAFAGLWARLGVTHISDRRLRSSHSNDTTKPLLLFMGLSLAGVPPLLGFWAKAMVILNIYRFWGSVISVAAVLASVPLLFVYLRLTQNVLSIELVSPLLISNDYSKATLIAIVLLLLRPLAFLVFSVGVWHWKFWSFRS